MGFDDRELAISTRGLRKTYRTRRGRQIAVQGLDLDVPVGGVHGFLGPNGSGKTTTIRMLLGLIRADAGTMSLFGVPVPGGLPEVIGRVGAIVEQPKFFPNFSARLNLELLGDAIGVPREKVDEVLAAVGLAERAADPFRTYSLGMKQRLAIAATMLKDPDLFIFDEPTNGLDPAGIREIRDTIRTLAQSGKTVLVSSHILAEVEQIADTISIIGHGKLLASGTLSELVGGSAASVRLLIDQPDAAVTVLENAGYSVARDGVALIVANVESATDISRLLASNDLFATELTTQRGGLEAVFLELTKGQGLESVPQPIEGDDHDDSLIGESR